MQSVFQKIFQKIIFSTLVSPNLSSNPNCTHTVLDHTKVEVKWSRVWYGQVRVQSSTVRFGIGTVLRQVRRKCCTSLYFECLKHYLFCFCNLSKRTSESNDSNRDKRQRWRWNRRNLLHRRQSNRQRIVRRCLPSQIDRL